MRALTGAPDAARASSSEGTANTWRAVTPSGWTPDPFFATPPVSRAARRGAIVVVMSDLVDLPENARERIAEIASGGRVLIVVQVLDPAEAEFPYQGTVRLRALEGNAIVETDADTTRNRYVASL